MHQHSLCFKNHCTIILVANNISNTMTPQKETKPNIHANRSCLHLGRMQQQSFRFWSRVRGELGGSIGPIHVLELNRGKNSHEY